MSPKRNTWDQRTRALMDSVGDGRLVGRVVVSQPYAAKQHVERFYAHPRGGGPDFVSGPLRQQYRGWYQNMADGLLVGRVLAEMITAMEQLSAAVIAKAPYETGDLSNSGHPTVFDNGRQAYDRPALAPRRTRRARRPSRSGGPG